MIYHESFTITGSANTEVADSGIESTKAETKHIIGCLINVSAYNGNNIKIYIDREKICSIPDYFFDTDQVESNGYPAYSNSKQFEIPVDYELPVGSKIYVAVGNESTATNVRGAYKYNA